jgi:hypothetical protein
MPLTIEINEARPAYRIKTYVVVKTLMHSWATEAVEEFTSEIDALTWADAMNRIDTAHAYYVRYD